MRSRLSHRASAVCYAQGEVVDYSKFPNADDEYTPEQRRIIDAEISEGQKGPYYGPFKSGKEIEAFLEDWKAGRIPPKLKKTG